MRRLLFVVSFFSMFLIGCVEEVDLNQNGDIPNKLVIHGYITPDSQVTIQVSKVVGVTDGYEQIADASLEVTNLQSQEKKKLLYRGNGFYAESMNIKWNDSLSISILHENNLIKHRIQIPSNVVIKKVDTFTSLISFVGKTRAYRIEFKDSAYIENYYRMYLIHNYLNYIFSENGSKIDSFYSNEKVPISGSELPFLRNNFNTYSNKDLLFSDESFNGLNSRFVFYETLPNYQSIDKKLRSVTVVLENIHQDLFNYLNSRNAHIWQQSSITQLPILVEGNIENGYGILSSYSKAQYIIKF